MPILSIIKSRVGIVFLLACFTVILLVNFVPGKSVIGFDMIAPYLSFDAIYSKAASDNKLLFVSYAPLLPIAYIFKIVSDLGMPAWLISQVYILSSIFLGSLGIYFLYPVIFGIGKSDLRRGFAAFFYLSSLTTVWLLNQAGFFFIAAYASIPWILIFLSQAELPSRLYLKVGYFLILGYSVVLFLTVGNNLVAFTTFTVALLLISLSLCEVKSEMIDSFSKFMLFLIFLVCVFMGIRLVVSNDLNVLTPTIEHLRFTQETSLTSTISDDLDRATFQQNSLFNSLIGNTNWVLVHDLQDEGLYAHNDHYTKPLTLLFGAMIPLILLISITYRIFTKKIDRRSIKLLILLTIGVVLSSRYVQLIELGPISDALRWNASKFWPLILIPLSLLFADLRGKKILLIFVVIAIFILHAPLYTSRSYSEKLFVKVPSSYQEVANIVGKEKSLYLPAPGNTYYYQLEWGYFGASIMNYLTIGDSVDTGILDPYYNSSLYEDIELSARNCDVDELGVLLKDAEIENIILDNSSLDPYDLKCVSELFEEPIRNGDLEIYSVR